MTYERTERWKRRNKEIDARTYRDGYDSAVREWVPSMWFNSNPRNEFERGYKCAVNQLKKKELQALVLNKENPRTLRSNWVTSSSGTVTFQSIPVGQITTVHRGANKIP